MRDDDPLWWTAGSWKTNGRILMCFAPDIFDACQTFGEEPQRVHLCSTPYLLERAQAHVGDGAWEEQVESFPSVYDQFKRAGYRAWDYQAMRDSGYDVE